MESKYPQEMLWWKQMLEKLVAKENLEAADAMEATSKLLRYLEKDSEEVPLLLASFFGTLSCKGTSEDELFGMVQAMDSSRRIFFTFDRREPMVTSGGGGGDTLRTINVTTPSFIVASAGGAIALKSSGRAASYSSTTGSADLASTLGVNIDAPKEVVERCVNEIGTTIWSSSGCYPWLDPLFRLRKRIISPVLFPLMVAFRSMIATAVNPFGVKRSFRGVTSVRTEVIGRVLARLGQERALIVTGHGAEGIVIDEVSNLGSTIITELDGSKVETYRVHPRELGIRVGNPLEIQSRSDHEENALVTLRVLSGKDRTSRRDLIAVNSAAVLYLADIVKSLKEGVQVACNVIDEGLAIEKLKKLVRFSGGDVLKLKSFLSRI